MVNSTGSNTKRIAKNTIVLYIRMIVIMIITLYISRVVLKALGFEDYGLYNVIGGVVALMSFLKSSMSESTQRFLSYEMGKGNIENLKNDFSVCLTTHLLIAMILLVIAETLGLWFLNSQLNIPEGREVAANWIYQFSVVSLCISIVSVPFSADIISHEQMGFFAFLSILDAVLKLAFAFAITFAPSDKLIFYGFLMMLVPIINIALNWWYCHRKHPETHYKFFWDKGYFKTTRCSRLKSGNQYTCQHILFSYCKCGNGCRTTGQSCSNGFDFEFSNGVQATDYKIICGR